MEAIFQFLKKFEKYSKNADLLVEFIDALLERGGRGGRRILLSQSRRGDRDGQQQERPIQANQVHGSPPILWWWDVR